jgi:outer membrane protein assembly factor BamB
MTSHRVLTALTLALLVGIGACKSDDDGNSCETENGAPLACADLDATCTDPSPWPKFRRDVANTGRTSAAVITNPGTEPRWVFPPLDEDPFQPIIMSPVIGKGEHVSLVARRSDFAGQQQHYRLRAADGIDEGGFVISGSADVGATPLLSANDRFIAPFSEDGSLREFESDGRLRVNRQLGSEGTVPPNIDREGTVYIAGNGGGFLGICANGGLRFAPLIGSRPSPALIIENGTADVSDDLFIVGGSDAIVHAFDIQGRQQWQFVASGPVMAAPIADEAAGLIYVVDLNGRIFAVRIADGTRCVELRDPSQPASSGVCGPLGATDQCVTASPAFGGGRLYIATLAGTLHAFDVTGLSAGSCNLAPPGSVWRFPAEGAVGSIQSSPALSAPGGSSPVIVFGADDGFVYAVTDTGSAAATLWTFSVDAAVGLSSPAIGSDGSVYVGTTGGRLYAIGPAPAS